MSIAEWSGRSEWDQQVDRLNTLRSRRGIPRPRPLHQHRPRLHSNPEFFSIPPADQSKPSSNIRVSKRLDQLLTQIEASDSSENPPPLPPDDFLMDVPEGPEDPAPLPPDPPALPPLPTLPERNQSASPSPPPLPTLPERNQSTTPIIPSAPAPPPSSFQAISPSLKIGILTVSDDSDRSDGSDKQSNSRSLTARRSSNVSSPPQLTRADSCDILGIIHSNILKRQSSLSVISSEESESESDFEWD